MSGADAFKRMMMWRDCLKGIKLPVIIGVNILASVLLVIILIFVTAGQTGPWSATLAELVAWVAIATVLNLARRDPYYSFEFVSTSLVFGFVATILTGLAAEISWDFRHQMEYMGAMPESGYSFLVAGGQLLQTVVLYTAGAVAAFFLTERIAASGRKRLLTPEPRTSAASFQQASGQGLRLTVEQRLERARWEDQTGRDYLYCRNCGGTIAIWTENDKCPHCGWSLKIPNPVRDQTMACINRDNGCPAMVNADDGYCYCCGSWTFLLGARPAAARGGARGGG